MKTTVIGCAIAGLIGILLGYTGAYVQFTNERDHGASYSQWSSEWFGLAALPGLLIADRVRQYDYELTEAWILDKHRIALMNGVFYLPLGLAVLIRKKAFKWGVVSVGDPLRGSPNKHP
jgi:hypothetical protein